MQATGLSEHQVTVTCPRVGRTSEVGPNDHVGKAVAIDITSTADGRTTGMVGTDSGELEPGQTVQRREADT